MGVNDENLTEIIELVNVRQDLQAEFKYFRCNICGSIQIINIPENLEDYYDNNTYYSFASKNEKSGIAVAVKKKIKALLLGKRIYRYLKREWLGNTEIILKEIKEIDEADKKQKVLDIGCGSGNFLNRLRGIGYKNLMGIDPFLDRDMETDNGVVIKKLSIDKVEDRWDQIWMIHSFEHMINPLETLIAVRKKMAPDGVLIMELPLCDSYEYKKYGRYWTGCDAPVHIVMYTKKGLEFLFTKAGLKIVNIYNFGNSIFLQLSEMAERGYSLSEVNSENIKNILGEKKINELKNVMKEINNKKESGLATLVIKAK